MCFLLAAGKLLELVMRLNLTLAACEGKDIIKGKKLRG